jgi:hypothetical protein
MISPENIQQIQQDLTHAGIDYMPLQQELLDHICIDVESEIEAGKNFNLAYETIKHQYIDTTDLIEVQRDTINLLDYKSLALKRIFLFVSAMTLIGFLLKTFKIPGSNWVQFFSIMLLTFLFCKIGFYFYQDKRQKHIKRIFSVSFYVVGAILPVSYFIYSFLPNIQIIATRLNMISYMLLSLSLTAYFSSKAGLNILGVTTETRKIDLSIASANLFLSLLTFIFFIIDYAFGLKYLLFIIIGSNFFITIYYLLIKQRFKNRLISLLIISAIIIHLYYLPFFIRGIFE